MKRLKDEEDPNPHGGRRTTGGEHTGTYDTRDGSFHSSHAVVPEAYYEHFDERKTYIGPLEQACAVGALYTLPTRLLAGRRIIHWVDNAGALSHLVNGYAGRPDSARLVNMFHIALLALGARWYGEWIPSDANIADIMTRPERFHELLAGLNITDDQLERHKFELPPLGADWSDLKQWMRTMRARAS